MKDFKTKELENLKKLRAIGIGFIAVVNFIIIGFFLYGFYEVYKFRNLKENFFTYVFPTVASIQLVLALAFGPVILIIFRRFASVLREIEELNDDFTFHYQRYTEFIYRFFLLFRSI